MNQRDLAFGVLLLGGLGAAICSGCGDNASSPGESPPGDQPGDPPTARIAFPPSPWFSTPRSTIVIRGVAEGPDGVEAVRVNGVVAETQDHYANWQVELALTPGENAITVETEDGLSHRDPQAATSVVLSSAALANPRGLAVDGDDIFVVDGSLPAVLRLTKDGAPAKVLFDNEIGGDIGLVFPSAVVLDGDNPLRARRSAKERCSVCRARVALPR